MREEIPFIVLTQLITRNREWRTRNPPGEKVYSEIWTAIEASDVSV